jgi:hypothetical protein
VISMAPAFGRRAAGCGLTKANLGVFPGRLQRGEANCRKRGPKCRRSG